MSRGSCTRCHGRGYLEVPQVAPLVPCDDPECALDRSQREAAEVLGAGDAPPGRAIFKGGMMKLSVAIKGFDLSDKEMAVLTKGLGAIAENVSVQKTSPRRTPSSPRGSRRRPPLSR